MSLKKILSILLPVYLIEISTPLASRQLGTHHEEELFNKAYTFYEEKKSNLTQKTLGQIEFSLKSIIENKNTSPEVLADTAYLLLVLDCKTSHQKAMNALFYRPDFNAALYTKLIRDVNKLTEKKALDGKQRRIEMRQEQQRTSHIDPQPAETSTKVTLSTQKKKKRSRKSRRS